MKRTTIFLLFIIIIFSCTSSKNSPEFITKTEGRYLFNSDEAITVFFVNDEMQINWRNQDLVPLKSTDSSFYLKEMNEKLIFVTQSNNETYIKLAPKREHEGQKYKFYKLKKGEKTPSEYFLNEEYEKALQGYLKIKKRDSLDPNIKEWLINGKGYDLLRKNKVKEAKEIFKINIALYPHSSNTYDSMADAYWKEKDTAKTIEYYKKALNINPENRRAKRFIKKYNINQ